MSVCAEFMQIAPDSVKKELYMYVPMHGDQNISITLPHNCLTNFKVR